MFGMALDKIGDKEKPDLMRMAQNSIGMKSEQNISIDLFYDDGGPMIAGSGAGETATAGNGIGMMVGRHAREMAVGVLAVVSLFMLMTFAHWLGN